MPSAKGDVLTYHGDNARLGWYNDETALTPETVNPAQFGKMWERDLGGQVYGQPLYVHNVTIRGRVRDVVYAATTTNRVHALDATTGEWLWPENADVNDIDPRNHGIYLGPPDPFFNCPDIVGPVGVLSTMVIDSVSRTLFVVNIVNNRYRTLPPTGPDDEHFYLHALDISSGRERLGWPVEIGGSYQGASFNPYRATQRGALLLLNGRVYIPFGSRCDIRDPSYRGWLFSYSIVKPAEPPQIFSPSVDRSGSGLWGPGGPSADGDGYLYISTGNGDPSPSGPDLSNSILRIATRPALRFYRQPRNYYTPSNQTRMNRDDWDLGSSSVLVVPPQPDTPTPNLLFTGGKDGRVYLVNRDFLGGYMGPTRFPDEQEDQNPDDPALKRMRLWAGTSNGGIKVTPAYFAATGGWRYLYVAGTGAEGVPENSDAMVAAIQLTVDAETGQSRFTPGWFSDIIATPTTPVVSSSDGDNGIVWIVDARKDTSGRSGDSTSESSALNAYDALTGTLLYSSRNEYLTEAGIERDRLSDGRKFSAPIVRDGKVYVGTTGIVAYGLLGAGARAAGSGADPLAADPANLALVAGAAAVCSVPDPIGDGNRDVEAIRQGVWKFCTGPAGYTEMNSYNNTLQSSVYFGIRFSGLQTFNEMDFQLGGNNDGRLFPDGGWFVTGTTRLEVFDGLQWQPISSVRWNGYRPGGPNLPEAPRTAAYGAPLRAYDIFKARFPSVSGYGLRIIGVPGQGASAATSMGSCGQIRIFNRCGLCITASLHLPN